MKYLFTIRTGSLKLGLGYMDKQLVTRGGPPIMKKRLLDLATLSALAVVATPAFAGFAPAPGPEAGVGLAAMGMIAIAYGAMRRRMKR